ncbi:hypothetical protein B0H19DRAFT_1084036 [Mycena capillaripes]|nr:hypothetical protein B0H19DRAFT_1084036 [Mycena capillaripes]
MSLPTATNTPNAREELAALIATADKLQLRANSLARTATLVRDKVHDVLRTLNEEAVADNVWVRAVAKTPDTVEAEHAAAPDGSHPWWVVFVGREPGLYTTVQDSDAQIKGCPHQQCRRRRNSKAEALFFYRRMHEQGEVVKWVELVDDDDDSSDNTSSHDSLPLASGSE